jgi:hypothetical protein
MSRTTSTSFTASAEVGLPVVDRLVDAELAQEVVLGRARRADHIRAARLGDLHGHMPDPAGRRVDQHPLPGLDLGVLHQRLPRGQRDQGERARLDVVDTGRLVDEGAGRGGDVLGVRAVAPRVGQHPEDLVAGCETGDTDADGLDDAGDVPAEGERRLAEEAAGGPVLPVGGVEPGGVDPDQDLVGARRGALDLGDFEDLGTAEGVLRDDSHGVHSAHGQSACRVPHDKEMARWPTFDRIVPCSMWNGSWSWRSTASTPSSWASPAVSSARPTATTRC